MSDLINRNDAIEAIDFEKVYITAYLGYVNEGNPFKQYNKGLDDAIKAINKLPSTESERTAKVIKHDVIVTDPDGCECMKSKYLCNACKKKVLCGDNYCSHCGAKLEW